MYFWQDVHAFSQPIGVPAEMDEVVVSTPMHVGDVAGRNRQFAARSEGAA
jgi:hypothetical protein